MHFANPTHNVASSKGYLGSIKAKIIRFSCRMSEGGIAKQFFESVASSAHSAASRLRVRSAINPMLWLCAITSLPCFGLAYLVRGTEPLATILLWLGASPIFAAIVGFLYFMIYAPEKLQSEEYQLRHETLELIRQKGSSVEISPSSLEAIMNPVHQLPIIGRNR